MVFSLLNYLIFASLLIYGFRLRFKGAETYHKDLIFYYCIAVALAALGIGAGYSAASSGYKGASPFFIKLTAIMALGTHFLVFLLTVSFPSAKQGTILRNFIFLVWLVGAAFILFTNQYLEDISFLDGNLVQTRGPLYLPFTTGGLALGLLSALILFIRQFSFESKIYKLQSGILVIGILAGYVITFLLGVGLPYFLNIRWVYPLMMFGAALMAIVLGYGVSLTRIVDLFVVITSVLSFILYFLVVGGVTGFVYAVVYLIVGKMNPLLLLGLGIVVFLLAERIGSFLQTRFKQILLGERAYAERLEEDLSSLDYSKGRDAVIQDFLDIVQKRIACSSVHLFIENNQNELALVRSISRTQTIESYTIPIKTPFIDLMLNNDVSILIKTEVITNYDYHTVKEEILDLLDKFSSDALVLLRNGRDIIGLLLIGSKISGSDFLDYDYEALLRVYGKLFVTAYYLKNIAQQSLVTTVDREIEYSEQIIQSLQENMDRIEHPHADIAFMTRSTRKLGGDFIDFVRMTPDRYMCVIGDVSGKGLNASMSMIILKSMIRTFLKETKDFKSLIIKINSFIKQYLPRGTFFSGLIGLFDFKERSLYFVNCGIPVMYLLSASYSNPVEIQGTGKVLGFVKDIGPYLNVRKAAFKSGDILLMTTDGLTDAESVRGVRFGKERIQKNLLENRSVSAERIVRFLEEAVIEFVSQELNDDITILAIKFL